jgi:hypothetical protein
LASNYSFNSRESALIYFLRGGDRFEKRTCKKYDASVNILLKHNDEMIYPAWIIYMNRFLSNSKCIPLKNASTKSDHAWMMKNNFK